MATRAYKIFTLKAHELLKICAENGNCIDLTSVYERDQVVKYADRYGESGLIYQMMRALDRNLGRKAKCRELTENLVYLNFDKGIADNEHQRLKALLTDGFRIRFRRNGKDVKFCSFDKSSSMSRHNTISFINEELFDDVNEALGLGIDWTSIDLIPSKYYAYRGLYMTDGIDVVHKDFILNEKTVIVLKTKSFDLKNVDIITTNYCGSGKIPVTPFDGEGIVSPEYSTMMAECIDVGRRSKPESFQIRMPFTKGMLHTVDFRQFFEEQFPYERYEDIMVEDYFGIKRSLADAKIILTSSMFKCAGWLKKHFSADGQHEVEGEAFSEVYLSDPMKEYFDRFRLYEHALYVVRTDSSLRCDGKVSLSYQFLNTLKLSRDELEELVDEHVNEIRLLRKDPKAARDMLLRTNEDSSDSEYETEPDRYHFLNLETWEYALMNNIAFVNDPMIRERLKAAEKAGLEDIRRGRINCAGANKFLSGDLLSLLINIGIAGFSSNGKPLNTLYPDTFENLMHSTIHSDAFYMPIRRTENQLNPYFYYGLLRNPHLSRNEQCALRPFTSKLYNHYFEHLTSVIMVSDLSEAPAIMGGADFDGDIIKFILDGTINKSILRGAYKEIEAVVIGPPRFRRPYTFHRYERKLPVAVINATSGEPRKIGLHISDEDLIASFSSRVGYISNAAIAIGKMEYGSSSKEVGVPENSTALCTIATGLEIDSVKNGRKPDISELLELAGASMDSYLEIKEDFKKIARNDRQKKKKIYADYNEKADEYEVYFKTRKKKDGNDRDPIFTASGKADNNIDLLLYYFGKAICENDTSSQASPISAKLPAYRFGFERWDDWRETAYSDPRIHALMEIIGSYRRLNSDVWSDNRVRSFMDRNSMKRNVFTILYTEYDSESDRLRLSDLPVADAVDTCYMELYRQITTSAEAEAVLTRMKDYKWQFVLDFEQREALFAEVLGTGNTSSALTDVICDTYDNGYQILNFILQDIKRYRQEEEKNRQESAVDIDEDILNDGEGKRNRICNEELYRKLYSIYCNKDTSESSTWRKDVAEQCRSSVIKLFNEDMEQALMCTLALGESIRKKEMDRWNIRTMDERHNFLWNVFEIEDIRKHIWNAAYEESLRNSKFAKALKGANNAR